MTRFGSLLPTPLATRLPARIAARRINWLEVARKDVADTVRSWRTLALGAAFLGLVQLLSTARLLTGRDITAADGTVAIYLGTGVLLPLVGLVLGYRAIVGERELGSMRILLGLPITRLDVVLGKLLSRSVLLCALLGAGLAVPGVVLWRVAGPFDPVTLLLLAGVTLVYGLVFVAIGVGVSAVARSRAGAMAAVTAVFTLLYFVWRAVPDVLYYLAHGRFHTGAPVRPDGGFVAPWLVFVGNANPVQIFNKFVTELPGGWSAPYRTSALTAGMTTQADPLYLQPTFLFLVLLLWGVVPLLVGAWWFGRRDLG